MKEHEEGLDLSAYIDGELSQEEKRRVTEHLSSCPSCRLDIESLRTMKRTLASAPRRAMPPELIAAIEDRLSRRAGWRSVVKPWIKMPQVWVPAGAVAAAVLIAGLWLNFKSREQYVPLEPLLAAHSRYEAEALVPQGNLVASNYSSQLTSTYGEPQDQEAE